MRQDKIGFEEILTLVDFEDNSTLNMMLKALISFIFCSGKDPWLIGVTRVKDILEKSNRIILQDCCLDKYEVLKLHTCFITNIMKWLNYLNGIRYQKGNHLFPEFIHKIKPYAKSNSLDPEYVRNLIYQLCKARNVDNISRSEIRLAGVKHSLSFASSIEQVVAIMTNSGITKTETFNRLYKLDNYETRSNIISKIDFSRGK